MIGDIISKIGNTPMARLNRIFPDARFRLFAKLEGFNPGGSIKDRTALTIIKNAVIAGKLSPGATVVESSSGNMGIGLAQMCRYFGLRFVCVVDPKTTKQNLDILRLYGAEIECVTIPDPFTGEYLQARIDRVKQLTAQIPHSFWPNQYANLWNAQAHHQTMREIAEALDGRVDYLFCATSTCGTLRGCFEYAYVQDLRTRIIAVDALGSVIFGGKTRRRLIPGHGASVRPLLYEPHLADECVLVSDLDCIVGCRRLVREELILVGGSSGAVISAVNKSHSRIPDGSNCVVILPDRGDRYLDTIYSDQWVLEHFGDVSHLWEIPLKEGGRSWNLQPNDQEMESASLMTVSS